MKITAATISNFKRIREVRFEPDADRYILLIGGNNAQGKSSAIDALTFAFGGKKTLPDEPVRRGADHAEVVVELDGGKYTIRRVVPAQGEPRLEVNGPDGKIASPQAWLDKLVAARFLDPLAFMAGNKPEDDRRRRAVLLQLVGLDLDAFARERKALFDERTAVGRLLTQAEAELARLPPLAERPPAARSQAAIREDMDAVDAEQRAIAEKLAARARIGDRVATATESTRRLRAQIAQLQAQLVQQEEQLTRDEAALAAADVELGNGKAGDVAGRVEVLEARRRALREEAGKAETLARWEAASEVATRQRQRAEDAVRDHGVAREKLTEQLAAVDKRQADALAAAEMPVPELGVTDDGVTIDGIPFAQASTAERMKASLAVAMKLSPNVQDIWIKDGSNLDDDSLATLQALAMFADCRLWIERVGEKDDGAIIIRDGRVAAGGGA